MIFKCSFQLSRLLIRHAALYIALLYHRFRKYIHSSEVAQHTSFVDIKIQHFAYANIGIAISNQNLNFYFEFHVRKISLLLPAVLFTTLITTPADQIPKDFVLNLLEVSVWA